MIAIFFVKIDKILVFKKNEQKYSKNVTSILQKFKFDKKFLTQGEICHF